MQRCYVAALVSGACGLSQTALVPGAIREGVRRLSTGPELMFRTFLYSQRSESQSANTGDRFSAARFDLTLAANGFLKCNEVLARGPRPTAPATVGLSTDSRGVVARRSKHTRNFSRTWLASEPIFRKLQNRLHDGGQQWGIGWPAVSFGLQLC